MLQVCEFCGSPNNLSRSGARFCSPKHRVYWHRRARTLPLRLTEVDRWVRAAGKRPIMPDGRPASSTDPATWSPYAVVAASSAGDGYGIMLGDGIGCYDLDSVSDGEARDLIAAIPEPVLYVERSVSGRGFHVFVEAPEGPGTKRWMVRHERYTRGRFILMTGRAL